MQPIWDANRGGCSAFCGWTGWNAGSCRISTVPCWQKKELCARYHHRVSPTVYGPWQGKTWECLALRFFPTRIIIPNGFTASYAKYRPTFHNGYVRPVRHSRVHPSSPAMFICLLLNEWGRVVGKRSKFAATLKVIEYSPGSILNPFDQWNWGLVSFSTQAFFYQDCVLAKLTMLICSSTVNPKFIGKLPSGYLT